MTGVLLDRPIFRDAYAPRRLVGPIMVIALIVNANRAAADEDVGLPRDGEAIDLSHVTDRTELSFEESEAYYALLAHARDVPLGELQQLAADVLRQRRDDSAKLREAPLDEFPLFYDLTQRPEAYRGQPVSMRGHLVRLVKYAAGPNEYGIETLYEGWLVTPDSQSHPATIVCTEIPDGMPIGEELIDGVSVTGFFFKLHTYPSRDRKIRFAPMVLAHRMQWSPASQPAGWPISQPVAIAGIAMLTVIAALIAFVSSRRIRRARDQRYRESVPETPPEFLNDLSP